MNLRQILLNLDLAIMCEHRQIEKVMLNGREIPVIAALVQYLDGNPNAVQELKKLGVGWKDESREDELSRIAPIDQLAAALGSHKKIIKQMSESQEVSDFFRKIAAYTLLKLEADGV